MSHIKVLIGGHLAGKTEWTNQYLELFPTWVRVSRRDILEMLLPKASKAIPNAELLEIADSTLLSLVLILLNNDKNIIIDDCHLELESIKKIIDPIRGLTNNITFKLFDEPYGILQRRNEEVAAKHGRMYTKSTLLKQLTQLQDLKKLLNFENIDELKVDDFEKIEI